MFNGIIAFPSFMFPVAITLSPIVRVIGPSFTGLLLILSFTVTSSSAFPAVWLMNLVLVVVGILSTKNSVVAVLTPNPSLPG